MTITHEGTGTVAVATSGASNPITCAPALPGGYTPTAGHVAVVTVVSRHDTEATPTISAGWDDYPGLSASGGGGTFGAGTGPARLTWFVRDLEGGESAPTVSLAGTNTGRTLQAVMTVLSRSTGDAWGVVAAFAAEATSGTGWTQAATTNPGITSGDFLVIGYGVADDQHAGFSAMGITATSATISAVSERADAVTGNGNDQGIGVGTTTCTAGTATAAPTITATIGTAETGQMGVLRLREATALGPTRQFDGTDDVVICAVGSGGMASLPTGATTLAAIAKRAADGTWDTPISCEVAAGNDAWAGIQIRDSTNTISHLGASNTGTPDSASTSGATFLAADGWCLIAVTKTSGDNQTPRTHKVVLSTGTPTHTNAGTTHDNGSSISGGRIQFGRWTSTDFFAGHLALVGAWNSALSDGDIETLADGLQAWLDLSPIALWQFRQASTGTSVTDDIGDADETTLTGTTVDTIEGPSPFDWSTGTDATATPAVIAATVALPASNRNIAAGPAVIARAATLPQATGSAATDATATPAVVATASTVPASNRNIVAGPAVLAGVTALPASARNVGAGPAIVATAASLPASNRNIGAGPAVIARAVVMPQATPVTTGNATPTPAVIATLAALARPAVNVTVGVSAIQLAALISEGLGVDGSAGPAVLAAVAALPQVTVLAGGNATPTPAAVVALATLARPAVNVAAGPTVTAALATLGQAIPQASVTKTPAVLAGVAALGQAIPQASVTTVPATLAALAALGGVGLSTGASPAVLGALAALVRPSVHVAAGPLVIARAATLPAPTVTAGGNVTVAPAAVAAVGALARAGVNVVAGPAVLAALSAVIRPLVGVGAGPAAIARVVVIGQATPLAGGGAAPSPATVAALAALAQPAVNVRAGPLVVPAVVTIGQAQPGQAASKSPATIAAVVALPAAGAGVGASPATILVVVAVPLVADVGGEPSPGYGVAFVGQVGAGAYVDQVGAGAYVDRKRGKVIVG